MAKVSIMKRDEGMDIVDPREALLGSIESILDDDEIDDATRNRFLIETVSQFIVYTGADTATARDGAPKEPLASPDIVIADVVKRVAAGEKSNLSKGFFEGVAKIHADRDRRPGETVEKARARYWMSDEGRTMRKAIAAAPPPPATERAVRMYGPAMTTLHKRAAELCAADRSLTRAKAVAKIAESCDPACGAVWAAARLEEQGRATA